MGASVFGGVDSDTIQLNEKSLWTGGPGTPGGYDYGNHDVRAGLERLRERIADQGWADTSWSIAQIGAPKQG